MSGSGWDEIFRKPGYIVVYRRVFRVNFSLWSATSMSPGVLRWGLPVSEEEAVRRYFIIFSIQFLVYRAIFAYYWKIIKILLQQFSLGYIYDLSVYRRDPYSPMIPKISLYTDSYLKENTVTFTLRYRHVSRACTDRR